IREVRRELTRKHAAERLPDRGWPVEPECADELLVGEHEIPEVVYGPYRLWSSRGGTRNLRSVDGVRCGEVIEERGPMQSRSGMEIEQRRPLARDLHPQIEPSTPDRDGAFLEPDSGHVTPPPAARARSATTRSSSPRPTTRPAGAAAPLRRRGG